MSATAEQISCLTRKKYLESIQKGREESPWFDTKEKAKGVAALVFGLFVALAGVFGSLSALAPSFGRRSESAPLPVIIIVPIVGAVFFGATAMYAHKCFTLPSNRRIEAEIQKLNGLIGSNGLQ